MFKKLKNNKSLKKAMVLGLAVGVTLTGCTRTTDVAGGGTGGTTGETKEKGKEPVVIRIGSHAANSMNPEYKDPVTGEYTMEEADREIRLEALQSVLDQLNVKIEWVQYPGETTEVLLQSVMAGDPLADVVNLYANSQGIILGQNILQPLDDYLEYFKSGPAAPIYGKHYFLTVAGDHTHPLSPLFYNINYIEQVDALKENGKTVYPTDLYKAGKWTWSTFEDYLAKIEAHYANSQAPERPEKRIDAYRTDYTETLIQAMHAAGGAIYDENGLAVESEGTKEAVAFVQNLVDKKLLISELREGTSNRPYNAQGEPFEKGESVFTNIEDWRTSGAASKAAERGESIGFIPFPRPDAMAFDDPNYEQVRTGGETWGILRGTDPEKIPLAIQAFELYNSERGRISTEINGEEEQKIRLEIDIFHPEIGTDMQEIYFESIEKTVVNEFSNMTGVYWDFMGIAGDAIYGIDGSPSYNVAIEAKKAIITDTISSVEALLNTTEVKDNIVPAFTEIEAGKTYSYPLGTDPSTVKWNENYTVADNVDGELDKEQITFDTSVADFNTVGVYKKGVVGKIKDSNDNEGKLNLTITVYDPNNKVAPTVALKEEYRTVKKDEDTSKINWGNDFMETAVDASGLDLKAKVVADLSELDATTLGTYNVVLTVSDYVGNETVVTVPVTVAAE